MTLKPGSFVLLMGVLSLSACAPMRYTQSRETKPLQNPFTDPQALEAALKEGGEVTVPQELQYLILLPHLKPQRRYRTLMIFHGAGDSAENYSRIWEKAALQHKTILIAPEFSNSLLFNRREYLFAFFDLLHALSAKYPIDPTRIYLAGASAGTVPMDRMIEQQPHFFRGAISIAGIGFLKCFRENELSALHYSQYPPLLYVHGLKDASLFSTVTKSIEILRDHNVRVQLYTYQNAGHEHRPEWNDRIFEWIESVEKSHGTPSEKPRDAVRGETLGRSLIS